MLELLEGLVTLAGWIVEGLASVSGVLDMIDAFARSPTKRTDEDPPSG